MSALNLTVGPLALFAFVASITPGPNNLLLMRSGAAFGVRLSLWHLFGVLLGFIGLIVLAHLGIGALLLALPRVFALMRWACFAYLLWLAWLILRDSKPRPVGAAASTARPLRCLEGATFQLINPKAWMMAITVASAFYGSVAPTATDLATAALVSTSISGPCMLIWIIWGAAIDRVLKQPRARAVFSYVMAVLVAATAVWTLG